MSDTTRDSIRRAFAELRKAGFNASMRLTNTKPPEPWTRISETARNYPRRLYPQPQGYWLSFGPETKKNGQAIVAALTAAGCAVEWDGNPGLCILVKAGQ